MVAVDCSTARLAFHLRRDPGHAFRSEKILLFLSFIRTFYDQLLMARRTAGNIRCLISYQSGAKTIKFL